MDLKERSEIDHLRRHPWETARAFVVKRLLGKRLKPGCRVLDIGCGDLFLEECLLRGNDMALFYCVDTAYSAEEAEALSCRNKNVRVYNNLANFEREGVVVDAVLLLDVVEHIEDDCAFLNDLRQKPYITPQTEFFITVPAFQSLFTSHDRFLGHYRRYNARRMKNLLRDTSFEIRRHGYFFLSLLLPRALQVAKECFTNTGKASTGLVNWHGGYKTYILFTILTMDYLVGNFFNRLRIRLPGLSFYAVCRKKPV